MAKKDTMSAGSKLLATLFVGKPLKVKGQLIYDIPTYLFWHWCNNNKVVPEDKIMGVYGEFLWQSEIIKLLEDGFMGDVDFDAHKKKFRQAVAMMLVRELDEGYPEEAEEDYISYDDVNNFISIMAKSSLWTDKVIKEQRGVVYEYMHYSSRASWAVNVDDIENEQKKLIEDLNPTLKLDYMDERIYYTEQFQQLEKQNWKKYVDPTYHEYIDAANLTELKRAMKDPMGNTFCPKGRQGEFILNHRRFNYVAAGRRSGKTFLGAGYLAGRQLMLPLQVVIYIVPTLKNHAKPAWRAMSHYFAGFPDFKMNKNDMSILNTVTKSELYFITAERNDSVRGAAANLLIIDEAAFVDEEIYDTASPLIRTTNGMLYCISTVNPETPKNWFYYNLLDAEIDGYKNDSPKYARRVPLPENPFIPDKEKAIIIKEGQRNPDRFMAEWMATFIDKYGFNLKDFWIVDESPVELTIDNRFVCYWRDEALDRELGYYQKFIISYDGAKRKDKPGLVVMGVVDDTAHIVMAGYLQDMDYYDQVDVILKIEKMLKLKDTEIVIDYGGAGVAVEEVFSRAKKKEVNCVQAVGGMFEGRDGFVWKIGKEVMLNKLKAMLELGKIKAFSFMSELRMEFETYTEEPGKRNGDNHWDLISAVYQGAWYLDRMGLLVADKATKPQKRFREEFDYMGMNTPSTLDPLMGLVQDMGDPGGRMGKFGY